MGEIQWLDCAKGLFAHVVRESARIEQWSVLAYRRSDFMGAHRNVDRPATLGFYRQLSGLNKFKMRTILCGAVNTNVRKRRLDPEQNPYCQCGRLETHHHIFLECPLYENERNNEIGPEEWRQLPNCLALQGVMPRRDDLLPEEYRGEMGRKVLAAIVQQNLLDIWDKRNHVMGATAPQPRWLPPNNQARGREPKRARTHDTNAGNLGRFQAGGQLRTGEHWNSN